MIKKYSKEIKVGLITSCAIAAGIWGINYLKGQDLFSRYKSYYVIYDNIDGLAKSNMVRINGHKIGSVYNIKFLPDNSGRIIIELEVASSTFINADAQALISSADLLGTKEIKMVLGNSSATANDGDTLIGVLDNGMMAQIEPVKQKIETLSLSLDSLVKNLNSTLSPANKMHIENSMVSIDKTMAHLSKISEQLDGMTSNSGDIGTTFKNVATVSKSLANSAANMEKFISNAAVISDTLASAQIHEAVNNLNENLSEFSVVLKKINNGEGSLGLLLNDDKMYKNLNSASSHLDSLLIDFNKNPKRYVHFSVFGKKAQ